MPTFRYLAKKGPTETVQGVLEAENRTSALSELITLGFTPVKVIEAEPAQGSPGKARRVRRKSIPAGQFNRMTRQFSSLVKASVPVLRTLAILKEQTNHAALREILGEVAEEIRQGDTLSSALEKHPKVFSTMYVSLIRSGEAGGMLDTVMERLALQAEKEEQMKAKIQAALSYPIFVGVVGICTVVFLLAFVMPKLLTLFTGFGARLPLPTRMLMAASNTASNGYFWAGVVAAGFALTAVFRAQGDRSRLLRDKLILKMPVMGTLVRQVELARFARCYGLLLEHGVPILQGTEIAIPVVKNRVIRRQLERLPAALKEGTSLTHCLKSLSVMTPFVVNTVAIGEESGKMGEALMEVANYYEQEVERSLNLMAGLLEPAMILMVGGIVGFIVMAVLLPIFDMSSVIR